MPIDFVERVVQLALQNVEAGGRPFASIIERDGEIIAEAANQVAQTRDPTAHAELLAIRVASQVLNSETFTGCRIWNMAHPCPMCLAAVYYCSPESCLFLLAREEYASLYVDDRRYFTLGNFYDEIAKPWPERSLPMEHVVDERGRSPYRRWRELHPEGVCKAT
ncbi:Guanine deaminase [Planctomycetes bacterium Pan216]|uniref:Guanine deaminase n=1 Tax=Kolteria novifilia TaxID=2527975 RepID=A0A518B763_9BACT|nr:Guanine deaminase [Planctomycetes bacterium Pan216]